MNEDVAYLVERLGPLEATVPVDPAEVRAWQGRLPSGLLELWAAQGLGRWARGRFQFCRPQDYVSVTEAVFAGDPEFSPGETHLIGYGAFAELVFWNQSRQIVLADLPRLTGSASSFRAGWKPVDANVALTGCLLTIKYKESFNAFEEGSGAPMFARCLKALGTLGLGECYGFFPPLAMGGAPKLANVKRVAAREHFAILSQLGRVRMLDYRTGGAIRFIRELGG